jgi:SAM-dependent methyltransferase
VTATPTRRWRSDLDDWRIPPNLLAATAASPWTLPAALFAGRARRQLEDPSGLSYEIAAAALPPGGSVLDVGAGAGAAALALRGTAGWIAAVDEDPAMLAVFADLAATAAVPADTVAGRWPDVAATVAGADVVVCHNVLYNVPDLDTFVTALTDHAAERVVVEITAEHPAALLNPVWTAVHGIRRPTRPRADDAIDVITATGVRPQWRAWQRPITRDGTGYDELIATTCRRLCVGRDRAADVEAALLDLGVSRERPYLGPPMRDVVTIWWDGTSERPPDGVRHT